MLGTKFIKGGKTGFSFLVRDLDFSNNDFSIDFIAFTVAFKSPLRVGDAMSECCRLIDRNLVTC